MKTIVALVDFSDVASKMLKVASEQAKAFDDRVILLHIVPEQLLPVDSGFGSPLVMAPATAEAVQSDYERLESLQSLLTQKG